jgi:glycosyltransferase involved in cell wall biosynthesis
MRVALVGNYAPDAQESMRRYAELLRDGLRVAGHDSYIVEPRVIVNVVGQRRGGIGKWLGNVDKYALGPRQMAGIGDGADVVHICDHSNAVYIPASSRVPHVITCHDLLAVRGARGENTDCPASLTGRWLQSGVLRGLRRADAVACVSIATLRDARRLMNGFTGELAVIANALNYPYRRIDHCALLERLAQVPGLPATDGYVLNVGSNLRRKNRECVVRAFARIAPRWAGKLVFAGQPLTSELRDLARQLSIADRVLEVDKPDNSLLEALYGGALALMFPSRFEGFGWPIVEAQACGCAVICSDRAPHPEVSGGAAVFCDADDAAAFAGAVLRLVDNPMQRRELVRAGFRNAARYDVPTMINQFLALYQRAAKLHELCA